MLNELKNNAEMTLTENGALAYRSTRSSCLDLFASCGAMRQIQDQVIIKKFIRAYAEDPDTAMRILFYARDIREGLGERRFFQVLLQYLSESRPASVIKNMEYIPEYGRYDDLLSLLGTSCEKKMADLVKKQLDADHAAMDAGESVSLLAKWLPSVNTSSAYTRWQAEELRRLLGMREKEYRKTLSALRRYIGILETDLCEKNYTFDYEKCPGKALFQYRRALRRNDPERYDEYIRSVQSGYKKMNTATLYPYEIVRAVQNKNLSHEISEALDATWNSLPDYTDSRNALAVIDGSGSMYWDYGVGVCPAAIAMSLGIYFAERNQGHFHNHFITFSRTPQLVELKGSNIADRVDYCMSFNEVANTNLYEVFMLLLVTAVKKHLPQSEMPEILYIISDMEFDEGIDSDLTVFEDAKEKFEDYGYRLPQIVYWNVAARNEQYPVRMDERGTALVSGSSPNVFKQMMSHDLTPISMMDTVINSERYRKIWA